MTPPQLKRSFDRKVANAVSKNGKQAAIANTFGLPAGKAYSCPGATSVCESVCYAGRLEKVYPAVKKNLLHNWELLKDADQKTMEVLLSAMIDDFVIDCNKRSAAKLFRIHWDGDFFSDTYASAWRNVITNYPDIQFWVYTRVEAAAVMLKGIPNLSLYYSTDSENKQIGVSLKKELFNRPGAKCPENLKAIPLISNSGSACVSCGLCVYSKSDIVFSSSKK